MYLFKHSLFHLYFCISPLKKENNLLDICINIKYILISFWVKTEFKVLLYLEFKQL